MSEFTFSIFDNEYVNLPCDQNLIKLIICQNALIKIQKMSGKERDNLEYYDLIKMGIFDELAQEFIRIKNNI